MEEDGDLRGPREEEVAVARVDEEVVGHRLLRGGKTLGDDGAAKDAAGARWVPWCARVREDVLVNGVSLNSP